MSENYAVEAERIKNSVKLVARCPILRIKQAMLASGFLENDASSRSIQMKIRRRLPKGNKGSLKTPTDEVSTNTPGSVVSLITTPSSGASSSSKLPRPKRKQQQRHQRTNSGNGRTIRLKKSHAPKAHKRAMNWYAAEKEKVNGMGALNISELVKD